MVIIHVWLHSSVYEQLLSSNRRELRILDPCFLLLWHLKAFLLLPAAGLRKHLGPSIFLSLQLLFHVLLFATAQFPDVLILSFLLLLFLLLLLQLPLFALQ